VRAALARRCNIESRLVAKSAACSGPSSSVRPDMVSSGYRQQATVAIISEGKCSEEVASAKPAMDRNNDSSPVYRRYRCPRREALEVGARCQTTLQERFAVPGKRALVKM
jgi:hypothetical protein